MFQTRWSEKGWRGGHPPESLLCQHRNSDEPGLRPVVLKYVADIAFCVAADAVVLFLGIEVVGHSVQAYAAVSDSLKSQQEMIYAAEAA